MTTLLAAIASIGLAVAAQFSLKAGVTAVGLGEALLKPSTVGALVSALQNKWVILGLVLYALSAVSWLAVLSRWDVSKAYPLVGAGFAAAAVIGLLAGEHVTLVRALGVALVCAGVWLIGQT
jgi:multidrug transporter EmrE-like cation transporter